MQVFKKHIAVVLLSGFLFPQIAGSLHFLVVPHDYSVEKETALKKSDGFNQYHFHHYHFTNLTSLLTSPFNPGTILLVNLQTRLISSSLEHYVQYPKYNFLLRGPPHV